MDPYGTTYDIWSHMTLCIIDLVQLCYIPLASKLTSQPSGFIKILESSLVLRFLIVCYFLLRLHYVDSQCKVVVKVSVYIDWFI